MAGAKDGGRRQRAGTLGFRRQPRERLSSRQRSAEDEAKAEAARDKETREHIRAIVHELMAIVEGWHEDTD
jgi:hypothetical protein